MNANKVILMGRVITDITPITLNDGLSATNLTLSVHRKKKNDDQAKLIIQVTFYSTCADSLVYRVEKGDLLYVEGRLVMIPDDRSEGQQRVIVVGDYFQSVDGGILKNENS